MDDAIRGAAGGALIGLAAAALLLASGRVAGVSGIFGRALRARCPDRPWRLAFLVGLPAGGLLVETLAGSAIRPQMTAATPLLVAAGLLVGFGTQLGSGCTSGHGVCGVARGSRRSVAATLVFMAAGMVTVFVQRHVLGG